MKITDAKVEAINNRINQLKKFEDGLGINIDTTCGKTSIYKKNWGICDLEELSQMIKELNLLKQAVEEETGLVL